MGALLIDRRVLPLARAVQRVPDMPVISWGNLLDYSYSIIAHRDYYGHA